MSTVFDTLIGRGSTAAPPAGTTFCTLNALAGAVYSISAVTAVLTPNATSSLNVGLWDGGTLIAIMYDLIYSGSAAQPINGTINVQRYTMTTVTLSLRATSADAAPASYFGEIQANPLRGSFQSS